MIPTSSGAAPVVVNQTSCVAGLELCCPVSGFSCGMTYPPVANAPQPITAQGQAPFGAFPWQAAILTLPNAYIAAGALIDDMTILTSAHKIQNNT